MDIQQKELLQQIGSGADSVSGIPHSTLHTTSRRATNHFLDNNRNDTSERLARTILPRRGFRKKLRRGYNIRDVACRLSRLYATNVWAKEKLLRTTATSI